MVHLLVGLLSDTHNQELRVIRVLRKFREHGIETVLHGGDLTSTFMVPLFDGFRLHLAMGNLDEDILATRDTCRTHGFQYDEVIQVELDGLRIGVVHGDDPHRLEGLVNSGSVSVVVTGHTHAFRDEHVGKVRLINPGAMTRAEPPSAAILDTASGNLERILL